MEELGLLLLEMQLNKIKIFRLKKKENRNKFCHDAQVDIA